MKNILTTSVSLPLSAAFHWRRNRLDILRFAARFLRIKMRSPARRCVTRTYNRNAGYLEIVTTRFTMAEYDTLHYVAASLRVSVSSLIYGLIQLWLKRERRQMASQYATNYSWEMIKWDPEAGIFDENLTFWRIDPDNPTQILHFITASP